MSVRMVTREERIDGFRKAITNLKRDIISSHLGDNQPIGRREIAQKKIKEYEDKIVQLEKEIEDESKNKEDNR